MDREFEHPFEFIAIRVSFWILLNAFTNYSRDPIKEEGTYYGVDQGLILYVRERLN